MSTFDETVDFVIVGSGGGSMCAGLVMCAQGRDVLILEKTGLIGGTTAMSGGVMWIPCNPFMRRDGVQDSPEQAMTYLENLAADFEDAPAATPVRRQRYVDEAPRMIDFLMEQGIRLDRVNYWPDYYTERPGASEPGRTVIADLFNARELGEWEAKLRPGFTELPAALPELLELPNLKRSWKARGILLKVILRAIGAKLTGKRWVSAGAALQGRMLQAALEAGVELRTDSPVNGLIVEEGRVTGVLTAKHGKPWRIGARLGVLVNAGGFARNQRMRDRYIPGTSVEWSNAGESDTGEMIEQMVRHGAALAQMEEMVGYQSTFPPGSENDRVKPAAQRLTAAPHAILVDQSGVRYMNEGGSYAAYCKGMLQRNHTVTAVPSWAVFDSQFIDRYMLAGTMPGRKKPASWTEQGYLKQAGSIESLAAQIEVPAATLRKTVERFNGFVRAGHDEDYHRGERAYDNWLGDPANKPLPTLGSIEKSPFYAVPIYPGDVGTYGGVVTDEHARVLREDGSVIDGLYATGVSTASVMGRIYPGAGCSIGPSFVWGFVAAKHAVGHD